MKAKELAKKLLENPDFEVEFVLFEADGSVYGAGLRRFTVDITDIGYSSKLLLLGGKEDRD
jgi:hypothetical protein